MSRSTSAQTLLSPGFGPGLGHLEGASGLSFRHRVAQQRCAVSRGAPLRWGNMWWKPWFLPSNIGVSCKISHPILWFSGLTTRSHWKVATKNIDWVHELTKQQKCWFRELTVTFICPLTMFTAAPGLLHARWPQWLGRWRRQEIFGMDVFDQPGYWTTWPGMTPGQN